MNEKKVARESWGKKVRGQFMAGILVVVPAGASILILVWVFTSIDNILQPAINTIFGHNIPGVGFGATIILIYVVGAIARNILGKRTLWRISLGQSANIPAVVQRNSANTGKFCRPG
jgi:uncharacterized membrane protein